MNLYSAFS